MRAWSGDVKRYQLGDVILWANSQRPEPIDENSDTVVSGPPRLRQHVGQSARTR